MLSVVDLYENENLLGRDFLSLVRNDRVLNSLLEKKAGQYRGWTAIVNMRIDNDVAQVRITHIFTDAIYNTVLTVEGDKPRLVSTDFKGSMEHRADAEEFDRRVIELLKQSLDYTRKLVLRNDRAKFRGRAVVSNLTGMWRW